MIDAIFAQASAIDKCQMFAGLSLLKEELVFSDLSPSEELATEIEFLFGKIDSLLNMSTQQVKHEQS